MNGNFENAADLSDSRHMDNLLKDEELHQELSACQFLGVELRPRPIGSVSLRKYKTLPLPCVRIFRHSLVIGTTEVLEQQLVKSARRIA
jgi:hypothetical protein